MLSAHDDLSAMPNGQSFVQAFATPENVQGVSIPVYVVVVIFEILENISPLERNMVAAFWVVPHINRPLIKFPRSFWSQEN